MGIIDVDRVKQQWDTDKKKEQKKAEIDAEYKRYQAELFNYTREAMKELVRAMRQLHPETREIEVIRRAARFGKKVIVEKVGVLPFAYRGAWRDYEYGVEGYKKKYKQSMYLCTMDYSYGYINDLGETFLECHLKSGIKVKGEKYPKTWYYVEVDRDTAVGYLLFYLNPQMPYDPNITEAERPKANFEYGKKVIARHMEGVLNYMYWKK